MASSILNEAAELLEKANANLEPDLLTATAAREVLAGYARVKKLASFGEALLARRVDDSGEVARVTGTSLGKAKQTTETGAALADAPEVGDALARGEVSLDQANEIAKAEQARPGAAEELLTVARDEAFHVLRDKARKVRLEAEQSRGLGDRQHQARSARSYSDELGMVNIHLRLEPHVGTPIVNRAEADADRLYRRAKKQGETEPFERMLADAYAGMLCGKGKERTTRPELVVLVSHEVATRGWTDVRDGEMCKIPGVGPVAPVVAKEIAEDAFLNGVFYDGVDLRHFRRWTRNAPVKVRTALELGEPPCEHTRCALCCKADARNECVHFDGSGASTAASGSRPKTITSNPTTRWGPRRPTTSSRGAGRVTRQRRRATAKPAS
jgi:hypothetical protein